MSDAHTSYLIQQISKTQTEFNAETLNYIKTSKEAILHTAEIVAELKRKAKQNEIQQRIIWTVVVLNMLGIAYILKM